MREVDYLWRAQLTDGDDLAAQSFLKDTRQTFVNDLGERQKLFTTEGLQLFRPEMFGDTADTTFYKQFVHSGISRSLSAGLTKELQDSGLAMKDGAFDLGKAVLEHPGLVVESVFEAVAGLPQSVRDGLVESGVSIGEGAAVSFDENLTDKLNAIYGTDISGAQTALLAIRTVAAISGAGAAGKAGGKLTKELAEAVGKKLDEFAVDKAKARIFEDRMKEVAFHRDDDFFKNVAEMMISAEKAGWKKDGEIWWPPENGKVPGTQIQTMLPIGTRLDRYGEINNDTDFLAPAGTPYEKRALPQGSSARILVRLEVAKPLPVEKSLAMPWFGEPGMGVQFQTTTSGTGLTVKQLIDEGYLRRVD